jgi:hypothetical protein
MDRYVGIQAALEPQVTRIFDQQGRTTLRLRNGRWVE